MSEKAISLNASATALRVELRAAYRDNRILEMQLKTVRNCLAGRHTFIGGICIGCKTTK